MELQEIPGYVPAALVICVTKALRLIMRSDLSKRTIIPSLTGGSSALGIKQASVATQSVPALGDWFVPNYL